MLPKNALRILLIIICNCSLTITYNINAQSSYIKGKIVDQFGSLPGADIYIPETNTKGQSKLEGDFFLEHKAGEFTLKANYLMYNTFEKKVSLKANDTLFVNITMKPGLIVDQTSTLGTKAKAQSSFETISPVDIISSKQINSSTQIELGQVLHYLSPSFNSTHQTISDGTDHIDPATLHGLGPDQLLVLINGKRRHTSSLVNVNGTVGKGSVGTDFNAIPISAIDRIEILRDGATTEYGSDAIAGVINIVLKKQTGIIALKGGSYINKYGDGLTTYTTGNVGFDLDKKGFVNITTEFRNRESTNRAGNFNGTIFSPAEETESNRTAFFNQTGLKNQQVLEVGNAATRNISLNFNAQYNFSNTSSFYSFGGRNYREGKAKGFYRFPKNENQVVLELFPLGFLPEILTDIQDDAITLGIKGIKSDWNIDFSHSIGINSLEYTIDNSNNASLGIASPKSFDAGGFSYKQNVTNLDFSKNYDYLSGVNIAFGAQLIVENYQIISGQETSFVDGGSTFIDQNGIAQSRNVGAQAFPGFRNENEVNQFSTNSSGYINVEAQLTKKWLGVVASRVENYNSFSSETTWHTAFRYKGSKKFSFRGSFSTGFRAPSLHQSYFNNTSTQFNDSGEAFNVGTFNNLSAAAEFFEIERLKPELSKHLSFGITSRLFNVLGLSLNLYSILIDDRIVLSSQINEGFENDLQKFDLQRAQFFTNSIDTRTQGIDINLSYNNKLGNGSLQSSLLINLSETKIVGKIRTPEKIRTANQEIFNREERSRIENAQPNFKLNFSNIYELGNFSYRINNTLFGSVTSLDPNDGDPKNFKLNKFTGNVESRDQKFKPKLISDFSIKYKINDFIHLTIGANNAFNIFPDKLKHSENTNNGSIIYSRRVRQFDVQGANYFGSILLNI